MTPSGEKINGDKKPRGMEFLWRQTIACRENVTVWTERQTDKIRNDTFRNARKRYRVHIVSEDELYVFLVAMSCKEKIKRSFVSE